MSLSKTSRVGTMAAAAFILLVICIGVFYYFSRAPQQRAIATASYFCDAGKTIAAAFYEGETKPAASPDQPPTPTGSARVMLSDGRAMTLPQTISADGGRYANADESVVFWSKGRGAFVLEHDQQTYTNCIEAAKDPGGLPQVYANGEKGFSIRLPSLASSTSQNENGYRVDESYVYQALGPGKDIGGVKFTIPTSMASGTNLGADSYLSVEKISDTQTCSAALFLYPGVTAHDVTESDTTYSVASSTDAGAGNRYEETIYALPGTNSCIAVRYFVHYSVFENYPPGTVREFDRQAIIAQFDQIRRTLVIN